MSETCFHCEVHHLIDEFAERIGGPLDVNALVDDLIAVAAELIALMEDPKARKAAAKKHA